MGGQVLPGAGLALYRSDFAIPLQYFYFRNPELIPIHVVEGVTQQLGLGDGGGGG